jgi:hypothetical protein
VDEHSQPWERVYLQPELNPRSFSSILKPCQNSLEHLKLSFQHINGNDMDRNLKVEGLRQFNRLTSLSIEERHLESFSDLPSSLTELAMHVCRMDCLPWTSMTTLVRWDLVDHCALRLKRVRFDQLSRSIPLEEIWEEEADFSPAIAQGSWTHTGPYYKPCCLETEMDDIQFIFRYYAFHGPRHPHWNFLLED